MAPLTTMSPSIAPTSSISVPATASNGADPQRNFRFFDNRQKYLLFVNTCSEKWVVANRVSLELHNIHPRPPALQSELMHWDDRLIPIAVECRPIDPWKDLGEIATQFVERRTRLGMLVIEVPGLSGRQG